MATHGRGVIILDDITPLRQISQDVLAKDVHFFDMKPAVIETIQFGTGTATELSLWVITHLKCSNIWKRHTLGKMDLEIQDKKAANLSLPCEANKRNQRCNLGLHNMKTKIAAGKQYHLLVYCATCSRGNYKVVMTKGRYFTHTFKVLNDPKVAFLLMGD
jgi:hypothetical protein